MDKKFTDSLIRTNQAILCSGLFNGPRLTPTGKISHARTRVYTQRYRKEWETMPDFKGWLTSVPNQATRAYCTFCKKNLHAHRLSLLKHTCTMKHQRAALMHQNEMNAKQATAAKIEEIEAGYVEEVDPEEMIQKESNREVEEDNEDFEYVVETLDMEDDELNDSRCKEQEQCVDEEADEEEDENNMHGSIDEDDPSPVNKKIKLERQEDECRDTLAEAMAHVHGEYLDGTDEQANVELEMVVGEDEVIHGIDHDMSMNSIEEGVSESQNNDIEGVKGGCEKSLAEGDSSEMGSESEILPDQSVHDIGTAYRSLNTAMNDTKIGLVGSHLTFGNSVAIPPGQTKTFKLNTGKTMTLKPGTQYVVSNIKGNNIPGLVWADRKPVIKNEISMKSGKLMNSGTQKVNPYVAVAGTSEQSSSQKSPTKSESSKKPCISTHVLDTSKGLPVGGLQVSLYKLMDGRWTFLNESNTSPSGRCNDLVGNIKCNFTAGRYKMHFDVDKYFTLRRIETMFPFIEIVFDVKNPTGNYHIPVLLSPFGYTTYRGSDR